MVVGTVHIVLDGDTAPLPKKGGRAPQFSAHLYCGQTAGCIKVALGMEVGLSLGDCVRCGPSPLPQKRRSPTQFSAHIHCGQTAARIKMPLGMEVGLSPGDFVLDGDLALPLPKGRWRPGAESPNFSAHGYCCRTAGWIKMVRGMEVGLGLVHIVLDGDRAPHPKKGGRAPNFRPMFILVKRLDG